MPAYRAVLFDFFGTLTCAVRRGRQHEVVAEHLGCTAEALGEVLDRSFYLRASGALGDATATLRWVCERAGARPSPAGLRAAVAARVEAVRADTRLRPDAVTVLRALKRRGTRTALVSDCTHELPAFLPRLPVAPLLDVQVFSVRVGCCKPDPAIYLTACRRLGVAPADCLYVGDGGSQELTGASRTGMTAVRLAAADLAGHLVFNPDDGWTGPALTSLTQVVDLLDGPRPPYRQAGDPALVPSPDPWPPAAEFRARAAGRPDTTRVPTARAVTGGGPTGGGPTGGGPTGGGPTGADRPGGGGEGPAAPAGPALGAAGCRV